MSLQARLLVFYLITTLGYSVTSLATFLSIESNFHSMGYLGAALSLRTLSSCIFGYKANHLIQKINIRNSFICSFVFGLLSIGCIFSGFYYHVFLMVLFGLVLLGLPSVLTTILLTITLRISSKNENTFRKFSGSRELVFGFSRLFACLLAPILLLILNIKDIIFANLITYIVGLLIFFSINFQVLLAEKTLKPAIEIRHLIFKSRETWLYICQIASSMLLIALIPLFASSESIFLTKNVPILLRQSLWSVEAVTMVMGSAIYIIAKHVRENEGIKAILMLNGMFLLLLLLSSQAWVIVAVAALISFSIMLSFYIFRDDYVVNAGNDTRLIEVHASCSAVIKDLIASVSPMLLTFLLAGFRLEIAISLILFIQGGLYFSYVVLTKTRLSYLQA